MGRGFAEGVVERVGSFRFRAPVEDLDMWPGDYVLVSSGDKSHFLGQVEDRKVEFVLEPRTWSSTQAISAVPGGSTLSEERSEMVPRGQCEAAGRLLAGVEVSESGWTAVLDFDLSGCGGGVIIQGAPDEAVESFIAGAHLREGAVLPVGALLGVSRPIRVKLIPDGFKRPTGLFGQSGSGKSFALGIILEELVLNTNANVVVLDPNGDFVRFTDELKKLDEINDQSSKCLVKQGELDEYRELHGEKVKGTVILSSDGSVAGARPIFLRPSDLELGEAAAALRLDRVRDEDEYYLLETALGGPVYVERARYGVNALRESIDSLVIHGAPETRITRSRLVRRLRNMGFDSLKIWRPGASAEGALVRFLRDDGFQAVIIDLSSLDRLERALVSSVVFRTVWDIQVERRELQRRREGVQKCTVLVLDEAHHVFPGKTLFREQELTVDWGSRLAGEGRKFGVYLLVASQLPSKVHEHVLTQCGNVVLMRMVSQSDIDALQDSFSFVPETLLERSKWFGKGEGLVIGHIVPAPCLVHFEGRKTQEGGRDLDVDWGGPSVVE